MASVPFPNPATRFQAALNEILSKPCPSQSALPVIFISDYDEHPPITHKYMNKKVTIDLQDLTRRVHALITNEGRGHIIVDMTNRRHMIVECKGPFMVEHAEVSALLLDYFTDFYRHDTPQGQAIFYNLFDVLQESSKLPHEYWMCPDDCSGDCNHCCEHSMRFSQLWKKTVDTFNQVTMMRRKPKEIHEEGIVTDNIFHNWHKTILSPLRQGEFKTGMKPWQQYFFNGSPGFNVDKDCQEYKTPEDDQEMMLALAGHGGPPPGPPPAGGAAVPAPAMVVHPNLLPPGVAPQITLEPEGGPVNTLFALLDKFHKALIKQIHGDDELSGAEDSSSQAGGPSQTETQASKVPKNGWQKKLDIPGATVDVMVPTGAIAIAKRQIERARKLAEEVAQEENDRSILNEFDENCRSIGETNDSYINFQGNRTTIQPVSMIRSDKTPGFNPLPRPTFDMSEPDVPLWQVDEGLGVLRGIDPYAHPRGHREFQMCRMTVQPVDKADRPKPLSAGEIAMANIDWDDMWDDWRFK